MGKIIMTKTSNRKGKSIYLLKSWKFALFFIFNIAVFVVPVLLLNLISIDEAKMV